MIRVRSRSGSFIALLPESLTGGFTVVATSYGVAAMRNSWPCSRLRIRPIVFEFAGNGDLVDMDTDQDGEDLLALSQDAQSFGESCINKRRGKI